MQAFQAMAGAPPVPPPVSAVPPPAPPPPDKPPPPPHENDQPLYGNAPKQDTSIPPPVISQSIPQTGYNNAISTTGNNQNWPYASNVQSDPQQLQSVNTEALKKLAEEERLFDIQFKKWEEEIEKWRKENVNHPDKQAYKEYEQKFEACRSQLLERRQQMKLKRARLSGNTPQAANATSTGNISTAIPPQSQSTLVKNFPQNMVSNQQIKNNVPAQSHTMQNTHQYQQFHNVTQQGYNKNNNKSIDSQERYESYKHMNEDLPSKPTTSNFLPSSQPKGIPGLDLVPEVDKSSSSQQQDVIDITEEKLEKGDRELKSREPDYSTISKGINNILGDEKIMNILSMVTNQIPSGSNDSMQKLPGHYGQDDNTQYKSNYQKNDYDNRQELSYKNHNINSSSNIQDQAKNDYTGQRYDNNYVREDFRHKEMPQEQHYEAFNKNMPPPLLRANMPSPRPLIPNLSTQQNSNEYSLGGFDRSEIHVNKPLIREAKPKWVDEPLFTPSIIVDYEHISLRLKGK